MNQYFIKGFEKIAAKKKPEKKKLVEGKGLRYLAGTTVGGWGANAASTAMLKATPYKPDQKMSEEFYRNYQKHHGKAPQWNKSPAGPPGGTGFQNKVYNFSQYQGGHSHIQTPQHADPDILAHELGHTKDYGKNSFRHAQRRLIFSRKLAPGLGSVAGLGMAMSGNQTAQEYAPTAVAAGFAPQLVEETKANFHAAKEMKRQQGWKGVRRFAKKTILPFGTYAALPMGAYFGAKALMGHYSKSSKTKKAVKPKQAPKPKKIPKAVK